MAKVIIYTRSTCGFCYRALALLSQKNVEVEEISIDQYPEKRGEMIQRSNGGVTVPQIFINEQSIGGCDELMALEYSGQLEKLLTN